MTFQTKVKTIKKADLKLHFNYICAVAYNI